ncbi:MAG: hypothetical protein AB1638_06380 [Nitrospirota bacterium]
MKKKIIGILVVLSVLLSFAPAIAGDGSAVLQAAEEMYGVKQNYYCWLPLVPRWSQYKWDSVLILSNFTSSDNFISIMITSYDKSTRTFYETLGPFEKKAYGLSYFGYQGDVLTDMWITSNTIFAAAALLMDINTGEVQATLPWFSNL